MRKILDLFFPPQCPVCQELLDQGECAPHQECMQKLYPVKAPTCMKCGQPVDRENWEYCFDCAKKPHQYTQGKALFLFKGEIKLTMYRFKYNNKREYANFFAEYAKQRYGGWLQKNGIDVIIPVPMYRKKKKQRGYNQAESFGKALAKETRITYAPSLIKRVKNTLPQKNLNDLERKNNLKNAFFISEDIVKYKKILIVDDIYTTGSTLDAIAEALHEKGVKDVYCMCICIGKGM